MAEPGGTPGTSATAAAYLYSICKESRFGAVVAALTHARRLLDLPRFARVALSASRNAGMEVIRQ